MHLEQHLGIGWVFTTGLSGPFSRIPKTPPFQINHLQREDFLAHYPIRQVGLTHRSATGASRHWCSICLWANRLAPIRCTVWLGDLLPLFGETLYTPGFEHLFSFC